MKVCVFGATGPTGRHLVRLALDAGHEVVAACRRPEALELVHERLEKRQADVFDPESVRVAVGGCTAVVSALGMRPGERDRRVYSEGMGHIVAAMHEQGLRRLIAVTASGLRETPEYALPWIFRAVIVPLFLKPVFADMRRMESVIEATDLEWTLVRPPGLVEGKAQGTWQARAGMGVPGSARIDRADLAAFMVRELAEGAWIRQGVAVAW
ncbi:MAG: SDR family oxidoreductase [Candidatus Sericytochromatia bacterium]|nr:SDR family oxidoreductase [Candidatus Sericytochromatia bacterium]